MNELKKMARWNLIAIAWTVALTPLVTLMCVKFFGRTFSLDLAAQNFGFCVIMVLVLAAKQARWTSCGSLKKKENGKIVFDERDQFISSRAIMAAYSSLCIFLLVSLIISLGLVGEGLLIPFYVVPIVIGGISITMLLVYSIAILVQYGWRGKGEKS